VTNTRVKTNSKTRSNYGPYTTRLGQIVDPATLSMIRRPDPNPGTLHRPNVSFTLDNVLPTTHRYVIVAVSKRTAYTAIEILVWATTGLSRLFAQSGGELSILLLKP